MRKNTGASYLSRLLDESGGSLGGQVEGRTFFPKKEDKDKGLGSGTGSLANDNDSESVSTRVRFRQAPKRQYETFY